MEHQFTQDLIFLVQFFSICERVISPINRGHCAMAFKKTPPSSTVPDSPDKLIRDLPRRKIPDALPHQSEVMRTYAADGIEAPDVALQRPTGSGKTLVGLTIGEWRRRLKQERVVYLCPTRQLVNQVVEQAEEKYGLTVLGFTGRIKDYEPSMKAAYQNADAVAVTTYSSLFNTNPYFNNADIIVVDDAHAAEGYVAALWSVRVERLKKEHETLHAALRSVLKPLFDRTEFARLSGDTQSPSDRGWADKIPGPDFLHVKDALTAVFDEHVPGLELQYP